MKKTRNFVLLTLLVVFTILFFETWLNLLSKYFQFFQEANGILDTAILIIVAMLFIGILPKNLSQAKGFILLSISPIGGVFLLALNYFLVNEFFHWKLILFWLIATGIVLFCKFLGMPAVEEKTSFFNLMSLK